MNFIRRLKYKKGFTLSELIVVLAIIGILLAAVAAFADPVSSMIKNTNAKSDTLITSKIMGDYIERRLAYADAVTIVLNTDAGNTADTVITATDGLYNKYKGYASDKTKCGILVFKYVEDSDPTKSTYKVYDQKIDDKTSYGTITDAAYSDAFYGNYSYFITVEPYMVEVIDETTGLPVVPKKMEEKVKFNAAKQVANLDFTIRAYNFSGEKYTVDGESEYGINDKTMSLYYGKLRDPSKTEDGIEKFVHDRVAYERVSFSLENVTKDTSVSYTAGNITGKDIIIFYSVRSFTA